MPVPITTPGPLVTAKATRVVASSHVFPSASTTVARSSAVSWPSRKRAVPVPDAAEGTSMLSRTAAGAPHEERVSVPSVVVPSAASAVALSVPGAYGTVNVAYLNAATAAGDAETLTPLSVSETSGAFV